ncbi:hypothetical protein BD560DRAFT_321341 [Blakeslea trispora]|nr:hypothetical protein BD560DRAFT_321341 [Blakeslea trispora]
MVQSIDITPHRLFEPTKYRPRIVREKTIPILEMWWYDAYEDFSSGTVYLFGKSYNSENTCYESCCVRLQDVQREIYVLPRQYRMDDYGNQTNDKVSLADVENELTSLLQNKGISSFKMETCNRKYAFDSTETPAEASYIRLNYSYIDYELPVTLKGRTFSRVFGANTGPLEHWIIQRHIMGPCWIRVADAMITDATLSWCKLNATTTGIHTCTVAEQQETVPPLTILSLNTVSYRSPNTNSNEIVAVSGFVRKNATIDESDVVPVDATCFTFVRLLPGTEYTEDMIDTCRKTPNHHIFLESTEEALLSGLINTIHRLDPDILVGHDFYGVSLNLLLRRMKHFNVEHWHKIGRIRHQKWPKTISSSSSALLGESSIQERRLMTGRIVCDTLMASRDLIKSKSYDLTELASAQLHIVRCSIEPSQLKKHFSQDSNQLLLLLNHCLYDAFLAYQLMTKMNVLLLTKQLTNISGNLWSHTLYGARLERNEYLLLHTFYQKKFVYPNKRWKEQKTLQFTDEALGKYEVSRKKPGNFKSKSYMSLSGGLVLEPKIGLYDDYVLLLDFNSLYPTIMQEFNVCFTNPNLNNYNASSSDESKLGVLPELVKEFVEQRKRVKKLMQNPNLSRSQRAKYEIQQMSLKLTANSMYGSLGSNVSRFESRRLAAIITAKGREVLENTVDLASKLGLDIIYGDTDSVMINTHQKKLMKAKAIGERFKAHINRHHQLLEIDIDSIFRRTLLARKKKYAALAVSERSDGTWQECVQIKGLDLVRRDWCGLSREVSEQVLQLIFQQEDQSTIVSTIHQYLQDVARKMEKKAYTIDSYIIRKQLTKIPQQYMNSKSNYHVTVAKSIRRAGQMVRVGDTVAYVMCRSPNSSVTVPCTPKEVVDGKLEIDIQWYLQKQILPPVYRICQPIDGTDIKQLASQLNVDINDLADSLEDTADNTSVTSWTHKNSNMFLLNDEQCYDMIEPPSFICSYCGHTNAFLGPIQIEDGKMVSGLTCGSCQLVINKASVWCQVRQKLELLVSQYYQRKWICNQEACGFSTRDDVGAYCVVPQCNGRLVPEISDRNFFSKLCYLSKLFDYSKSLEKIPETVEDQVSQYQSDFFEIKQLIDQWIQRSGYRYVDVPWVT